MVHPDMADFTGSALLIVTFFVVAAGVDELEIVFAVAAATGLGNDVVEVPRVSAPRQ